MRVDCLSDPFQHPSDRSEALRKRSSESRILPKQQDVLLWSFPANPHADLLAPSGQDFRSGAGILKESFLQFPQ
jgi:hypothetical protein